MGKLKADNAEALVERALAADIITKGGGGWLSFGDVKLGQGAAKAAAHLVDNDEVAVSIAAAIAAKESSQQGNQQQGGGSAGNGSDASSSGGASSSGQGAAVTDVTAQARHGDQTAPSSRSQGKPANAEATHIVVKAKAERGRWRAGRKFTREETTIALADLTAAEISAIEGDRELACRYATEEK